MSHFNHNNVVYLISLESLYNLNVNTNFSEYAGLEKAVLDRAGPYDIKEAKLKIQAHKSNTQFLNEMKNVLDFVTPTISDITQNHPTKLLPSKTQIIRL